MWESLSGALSMALVFFPFFQFDQFLVLKKKKAKKNVRWSFIESDTSVSVAFICHMSASFQA